MTKHIIYAVNSKDQIRVVSSRGLYNYLMSYFYLNQRRTLKELLEHIKLLQPAGSIFMLDSGAYSAWRSGKKVNLWAYIEFIKKWHEFFTHIVALDVIDNPVLSEVNHRIMQEELKEYDLKIMPVFQSGEPWATLDYMVEQGYKYIGISPNNNWVEAQKREWLAQVFSRWDFEKLGIWTHGFGYQSPSGIALFPFTSCDAASWRIAAAFGRVINLEVPPLRYSDRSAYTRDHVDVVTGGDSDFVKEICEIIGMEIDEMRNSHEAISIFNVEALNQLSQRTKNYDAVEVTMDLWADESDYYAIPFNEKLLEESYQKAKLMGVMYEGDSL